MAMPAASHGATISPAYTVTDLGGGFSFTKDASGNSTAVTNGDRTQTYAFTKYPVNYQVSPVPGQVVLPPVAGPEPDLDYTAASNQFGSIGFTHHVGPDFVIAASNSSYFAGSDTWVIGGITLDSPEKDFNTSGQVVGAHIDYAVVSGPGFRSLPLNPLSPSGFPGILDEMIPSTSNLHLAAGLYIDDTGRIIAQGSARGSNTLQDFLLTPTPEPSTFAILSVALGGFGFRTAFHRLKGRSIR